MDKVLVLSDVDGTLVRGSIVLEHACFLHDNGIFDFGTLPWRWRRDKKNELLVGELAIAYKAAIVGKTIEELLVDQYFDQVLRRKDFYSSLKKIIEIQAQGADVILVTGSPDFLVKKFAEEFGFKVIAASYEMHENVFTGNFGGMHGAEAKELAISELPLKDFQNIVAFGDTASDKPLFDVANSKFLVAPTAETIKSFHDKTIQILEK